MLILSLPALGSIINSFLFWVGSNEDIRFDAQSSSIFIISRTIIPCQHTQTRQGG
jgi:hypothetical protein